MNQNDRDLLDANAPQFAADLNLADLLPLLRAAKIWLDVHQEDINVRILK
jgi:hypothetical protein